MVMASKPLQFTVVERKHSVGKHAGKVMQVAIPTRRHRIDFRSFCERVAKSTTFNRQEVEAVLNYATEIAKDIVADGDIVDFGDLWLADAFIQEQGCGAWAEVQCEHSHRKACGAFATIEEVLYAHRCYL